MKRLESLFNYQHNSSNFIRTYDLFKAYFVFNMIMFHTIAGLASTYNVNILSSISREWRPLFSLSGLISLSIPVFAGFIFRNSLGPTLNKGYINKKELKPYFYFFLFSFSLEAIRLFFFRLRIDYSLNWHALHFISFSLLICALLLLIHKKALYFFSIFSFLTFILIHKNHSALDYFRIKSSSEITILKAYLEIFFIIAIFLISWSVFRAFVYYIAKRTSWFSTKKKISLNLIAVIIAFIFL